MTTDITDGITDLGLITPVIMNVISGVLDLFMQPPLVFFTGAAFCFIGFKVAVYLVKSAKNIV
jgi:hypothetical protein